MRKTRWGIELSLEEAIRAAEALERSPDWDAANDPQEVLRAVARSLRAGEEVRVTPQTA